MKKFFILFCTALFLSGCFKDEVKNENIEKEFTPGTLKINYYSDKSVKSLVVPPDLTKPNFEKSFRISEYSNVKENFVDFGNKKNTNTDEKILKDFEDIKVKKSGNRRWLVINKNSTYVWESSKEFLKSEGFSIKKSNKKIGIIETDYLENYPEIPDQSLGIIRSMLRKAIAQRYALPIVDKYRIRVEPIDETSTEVYLSLSSLEEVITNSGKDNENTIWQNRDKDIALETEMLYRLMIYLGGDKAKSKERIIQAKEEKTAIVKLGKGINGFGKLFFQLPFIEAWDNLSWAFDQLNIDVVDKDLKERTFYINIARTSDKGIFTWIFGDDAVRKDFQIMLKSVDSNNTEVYFNDISEENDDDTKVFSNELFANIAKQF